MDVVMSFQGVIDGQGHFISHINFHGIPDEFSLLGLCPMENVVFREAHDAQAFADGEGAHAEIGNALFSHCLF